MSLNRHIRTFLTVIFFIIILISAGSWVWNFNDFVQDPKNIPTLSLDKPSSILEVLVAKPRLNETFIEEGIFHNVNDLRISQGFKPLSRDPKLDQIAKKYAKTMVESGEFKHNPSWKQNENIAVSPHSLYGFLFWSDWENNKDMINGIVQGWKISPGHYGNLISATKMTGVGVSCGWPNCYFVQDFSY